MATQRRRPQEADPTLAVQTAELVKSFGDKRALDGIRLRVPRGLIYGTLGPNGAGKTTLVRVLSTLLKPDGGTAFVLGHDVVHEARAVRRRISLTGQFASVDEDLTGRENLVLLSRLYGFSRAYAKALAAQLLSAFELEQAAGREVKTYSGGQRRRLDIAASIIRTPDLLFLDEPTTGLDPRSRSQVWDMIRALVAGGTTVLLTTQYLEEADQLADRIAVIDQGKVIAEGTNSELKASVGNGFVHLRLFEPAQREAARELLGRWLDLPVRSSADPRALAVRVADAERAAELLGKLTQAGIRVSDFSLGQASLDEVFFALTGRATADTDQGTSMEAER